jgi:dihydroorotate dehydrogenase
MVEVNFASPNTKGLAVFFEKGVFEELSTTTVGVLGGKGALTLMKMPPHLDSQTRARNIGVAKRWIEAGGEGLTVINTVKTSDPRLSMGAGGKSGRPIFDTMMGNLKDYRQALGPEPIINAVGGITAERVPQAIIDGGADTVQVYTPFIYHGPTYVRDAKAALMRSLKSKGIGSLGELRQKAIRQADSLVKT